MGVVYRVQGANLGRGACLVAECEKDAIKSVANTFKIDEAELTADRDETVAALSGCIILDGNKERPKGSDAGLMRRVAESALGTSAAS